jgi:hypothetical protein
MTTEDSSKTNHANGNDGAFKNDRTKNDILKKTKDEGIRKGVLITSLVSIIILVIAGLLVHSHFKNERNNLLSQMDMQKTDLTYKITARDSTISEWIASFDEIEKNITTIREKEKAIYMNSSNAEIAKDKKLQVLEDIKFINTLIEQNKRKIATLSDQLKQAGGNMKVLQNKISELETSMKKNENEIMELKASLVNKKFEVEQLNAQVVVMQDTITKKDEKIGNQTFEMNKAFYTSGTYKELKAKGLLTKEGGFIGLGKTVSLTGNFPDTSFVQIDISKTNSISLDSKSAKLISEHPAGSYGFERDKDSRIKSLEIKDPALFWKNSKYAVVEISK